MDLGKKNEAMRENELLRLQQEYNKQYVENADTEYDLIRKMRHDFRDNYSALYTLLSDGNVKSAMQHIEKHLDKLVKTETFVQFNLKNTIDESVLANNPHLRTTKKNKSSHGYGTKIIRDIARKYHGKYDFYEEEGFFCCSVTLKK